MNDETFKSRVNQKLLDILALFEQMAVENERINGRDIPNMEKPYNAENYLQLLRCTKGVRQRYVHLAFLYGELYAVKCLREMATTYYAPSGENRE